jgi:hypothetical protein
MTRKIAISVVTFAAVLLALGMPASAANVFNQDIPISTTVPDLCSGELVGLTGTAHVLVGATLNDNHLHLDLHANIHATGTGLTSGASYVDNDAINVSLNLSANAAQNVTVVADLNLVGKGSVPNEKIKILIHVTMNANGDITAVTLDFDGTCH